MLRTYFIALFALGYYVGAVIQDEPINRGFGKRAADSLKAICLKNADETTYEAALEQFNHIKDECWSINFVRTSHPDDETVRLCIEHQQNMFACLNQFFEKFEPCMGTEENYLQQFIIDGYGNYSNYLCENILELIPDRLDSTSVACFSALQKNPEINPSQICYEDSKVFGDVAADDFTKAKLCSDLQNARTCHKTKFEENCPDVTKLKDIVVELLAKAFTPCQDVIEEDVAEVPENKLESSD